MPNPSEYLQRSATNSDISAIKSVIFDTLIEYGLSPDESGKDAVLDDIEKHFIQDGGYFSVIIDMTTGQIVGTCGLMRVSSTECELCKMYLTSPHRGKGLGKQMVNEAIKTARALGYKVLSLETVSPLREAISLYIKMGFRPVPAKEISGRVDQAFAMDL